MKRYLLPAVSIAILSLVVAGVAFAGDTGLHTKPTSCSGDPCVRISYDDGTGAAPVDAQPDGTPIGTLDGGTVLGIGPGAGMSLVGVKGFTVTVKLRGGAGLDTGGTFTAGTLQAYVYNPAAESWGRANDLDCTVVAGQAEQVFPGFEVPAQAGRVIFVPNGLGNPADVYVVAKR